jgi:hypothetical protein
VQVGNREVKQNFGSNHHNLAFLLKGMIFFRFSMLAEFVVVAKAGELG